MALIADHLAEDLLSDILDRLSNERIVKILDEYLDDYYIAEALGEKHQLYDLTEDTKTIETLNQELNDSVNSVVINELFDDIHTLDMSPELRSRLDRFFCSAIQRTMSWKR